MNQKEELRRDLLKSMKATPRDKRTLTVIYWKGDKEIHETHLSMDRQKSSFEHARNDLMKRLKNQKGQTYGWKNGKVMVYREIEYDYSKETLSDPKLKEAYYKYGFIEGVEKVKNYKFIIEYKDESRKVFYLRDIK